MDPYHDTASAAPYSSTIDIIRALLDRMKDLQSLERKAKDNTTRVVASVHNSNDEPDTILTYERPYRDGWKARVFLPRKNRFTGTWQFLSALLTNYPRKPHTLSDDMESFVHVFNWIVLRFHKHAFYYGSGRIGPHVQRVYDEQIMEDSYRKGCETKLEIMQGGKSYLTVNDSAQLNVLLAYMHALCGEHYKSLNFDILEDYRASSDTDQPSRDIAEFHLLQLEQGVMEPSRKYELNKQGGDGPANIALPITPPASPVPSMPVLNAHTDVLALFEAAIEQWKPNEWKGMKTDDQLSGLNRWRYW